MQALDIDFTPFPAISCMARPGSAPCTAKASCWQRCRPLGGGKMIAEVSFDGFTPQPAPMASRPVRRMSPGYRPQRRAGVAGAERYRRAENWSRSLASPAEEELAKRPGFRSFRCQQSSLLAFEFEGIHHSDLVTLLAESGIALRAGQHCAQPLLAALGSAAPCGPLSPLQYPRRCCGAGPRGGSRPEILVD
nr:Cysteine sulfinate desulfinase [Klebsiella pneumoniae]